MLKVQRSVVGSQASKQLQPGDVLLEIQGKPCADFVVLEDILDNYVGGQVQLALCRGGLRVEVTLEVQDLHSLIPHVFVELGLGIFHAVSYQTAQKWHIPLSGIYVAQAGFVFGESVQSESIMLEVNSTPITSLQVFEDALLQIP